MSITTMGEISIKSCVPLEEAMNLSGFGKFNILALLFSGFMLLGMIMETLGFSYIIPACQCDLELTQLQKGWLAAIPFACIILTSHTWGYLADTRGRKKILVFTMGVGSFFSILSSFSPDLVTFAALRFIAGIFIAAPSALGYAYLGEMSPSKQRDVMIILENASITLGTGAVPLIAWGILPADIRIPMSFLPYGYRSWRLLIVIFALPYITCSILFAFFPESPKFLHARGKYVEALNILRKIYSMNSGEHPDKFPVKEIESDPKYNPDDKKSIINEIWNQTVPLFNSSYIKYTVITCFLQFVVFSVTNGFYIWYPAILNQVLNTESTGIVSDENLCTMFTHVHVDEQNASSIASCDDTLHDGSFLITIILSLLICLASILIALSMNVCSKRMLLIIAFLVSGTSALSVHWVTNTMASIVLFSIPQFCGACIGIINAFVIEIFPTNVRAMAVCITLTVGRVGSIVGTNLIGYLITADCSLTFFLFSGLIYVAVVVCFALPSRKNLT